MSGVDRARGALYQALYRAIALHMTRRPQTSWGEVVAVLRRALDAAEKHAKGADR